VTVRTLEDDAPAVEMHDAIDDFKPAETDLFADKFNLAALGINDAQLQIIQIRRFCAPELRAGDGERKMHFAGKILLTGEQGILILERQAQLTGKTVSPKIYIAVGISGAVHHTCAIENADTVIAINPDKNARIFEYADYGIVDTF